MALLLKRPNLLAFPGGAPGIDPSHPASNNLLFSGAASGASFLNLVNPSPGTILGAPSASFDGAAGPLLNAFANADAVSFPFPSTAFSVGTIAGIFIIRGSSGANPQTICGDSNGSSVGMGISAGNTGASVPDFRWGTIQFILGAPAVATALNVPYFYAVSIKGGVVAGWVVRNLQTGQIYAANHATVPAATSTGRGSFSISNRAVGDVNRFLDGGTAAAMRSNTFLSLSQLKQWADDPWAFWYPRKFDFLTMLKVPAVGGFTPIFRKTLSPLGTRIGARQSQAA